MVEMIREFSSARRASPARPMLAAWVLLAAVMLVPAAARDAAAQTGDRQIVQRGNGLPATGCVDSGVDGILQSVASGDDQIIGGLEIRSGANGICESTPNSAGPGDDVHPFGITLGQGEAFQAIIRPQPDNICRSPVNLKNDDELGVPGPNTSTPRRTGIAPGVDGTIASTPGGDDVVTAVICPDSDATLESTASGNDVVLAGGSGTLCAVCPFGPNVPCIGPGVDDVEDSTTAATDVRIEYMSTGADGISQSTATGNDIQVVPNGEGSPGTICVNSGADGIADTLLCGNGAVDIDENGIALDTECEDGNEVSEDGCSDICQPEFCGDSVVQGGLGETCDDGNAADDDPCVGCVIAVCGDGFLCEDASCTTGPGAGPEECDDGNTTPGDGCDASCGTEPFCGDGNLDGGEECDDGNMLSDDGCDSSCVIEFCGDAIVQGGIGEDCEDGNVIDGDGCDSNCTFTGCGNGITTAGEQCDDGNLVSQDGCSDTCVSEFCGDGVTQGGLDEDCDDAGESATCDADCTTAACGDGTHNPTAGEQCDDGDTQNNDDCVLGCLAAVCGDGFVKKKDTPPFEECDDGNTTPGDGCSATCENEQGDLCGNGVVDDRCTAGLIDLPCSQNSDCDSGPPDGLCEPEQCDDGNNSDKDDCTNSCADAVCGDGVTKTKGTPPFEECDDANTTPGDGCSGTCDEECGNGQIDGACSQGLVGQFCQNNGDCDSGPPDGVCVTEECDWGISGLCFPGPSSCSNVCLITTCGNDEVECDEQCDLGLNNGVPGSGCTATCQRNLIGKRELTGKRECTGAWTLDSPPQDVSRKSQRCTDGDPCDFDAVAGQCTFRVGVCLNRPEPASCAAGKIVAVDLVRLDVDEPVEAAAAQDLTIAIESLSSGGVDTPDRCREGVKGKSCSIPDDDECDTFLGAGNGLCDIGTGVVFTPPLDPAIAGGDQITTCTPGIDVVVPAGEKLKLRTHVRRSVGLRPDRDSLRLLCLE